MSQQNVEQQHRAADAFSRRDLDAFLAICDPEIELVSRHLEWMFRGVPSPQGKRFSVEHIYIYRMADDRIAEHWVVRDDLGMMLQTGALSTSG